MEKIYTEEEMERLRIEDRPYEVYATELANDYANDCSKVGAVGIGSSLTCFALTSSVCYLTNSELGTIGITINICAGLMQGVGVVGFVNWKREKKQARRNLWAYKQAVDEICKGKYKFEFGPPVVRTYTHIDREIKSYALTILNQDKKRQREREM